MYSAALLIVAATTPELSEVRESDLCYQCPEAQHIYDSARHSTVCSLKTWHRMSMNKGFKRNNILKQALISYCLCFLRPRGWKDNCV